MGCKVSFWNRNSGEFLRAGNKVEQQIPRVHIQVWRLSPGVQSKSSSLERWANQGRMLKNRRHFLYSVSQKMGVGIFITFCSKLPWYIKMTYKLVWKKMWKNHKVWHFRFLAVFLIFKNQYFCFSLFKVCDVLKGIL